MLSVPLLCLQVRALLLVVAGDSWNASNHLAAFHDRRPHQVRARLVLRAAEAALASGVRLLPGRHCRADERQHHDRGERGPAGRDGGPADHQRTPVQLAGLPGGRLQATGWHEAVPTLPVSSRVAASEILMHVNFAVRNRLPNSHHGQRAVIIFLPLQIVGSFLLLQGHLLYFIADYRCS